jgi:hypothetical protein
MRRTLEYLSTWIFRIAAISVLALTAHAIVREQSRPAKVDLQDARYLERMEDFIKREQACTAAMAAKRKTYGSTHGRFNGRPPH